MRFHVNDDMSGRHGTRRWMRRLAGVALALCVVVLGGCTREKEAPPITLTYTAGEHGAIEGASPQKVQTGGAGSLVRAVPSEGYHFARWSDGRTAAARSDRNVTTDLSVTAEFALNRYTLTFEPAEGGAVDGPASQIVGHGGDAVTVTAMPTAGYHFLRWSDGITTAARTDRNVRQDGQIKAEFALNEYALNYLAGDNGSIEGRNPQVVVHGADAAAVTAVPADGFHFARWSDGEAEATRTDLGVTADLTVTAEFERNRYTLTYAPSGNGAIDGATPQVIEHGSDGSIVTAVPGAGSHFVGWSDGVSVASRVDKDVTADAALSARFAVNRYALTYEADAHGAISGPNPQTVDHGSAGRDVTAVADPGYHFTGWSDGVMSASRREANVIADATATAHFAINLYALSYGADGHGSIDGVSPQTVEHGASGLAVTAVPEKGYHFTAWSDGLTAATRTDSGITQDLSVRASFAVNTYTVAGRVAGLVTGTEVMLGNQSGERLAVEAGGAFSFEAELLDGSPYWVEVATQPTSPNQTCTVKGGAGRISGANVTDVEVSCVINTYTVGGTVFGLREGQELVLQNKGADDLVVREDGAFVFATALEDGSRYKVTISGKRLPANWFCRLENAEGVLEGRAVTGIDVACFPEAELDAVAGIRRVNAQWNSQDFRRVTFNLCRAEEEIPQGSFRSCGSLRGGVLDAGVSSPRVMGGLNNDTIYWMQLEVVHAGDRRTYSEAVSAIPFGGLNDTGIDWGASDEANLSAAGTRAEKEAACEAVSGTYPGQDALCGRDAVARARALPKSGSGTAGFDFSKVCGSGEAAGEGQCPPNPSVGAGPRDWACVRDNVTGLVWEVKTDADLRSASNTYSWYNPDETTNGGDAGEQDGGKCTGSACDTWAFVEAVNAVTLCGATDWRLPTRKELLSIVDNGRFDPAINTKYFPNTLSSYLWSSTPYAGQEDSAWHVYFLYGEVYPDGKKNAHPVRLVRGSTATFGFDNP